MRLHIQRNSSRSLLGFDVFDQAVFIRGVFVDDRDFAVAADRATQLRNEAANIGKAIQHYESVLRAGQEQADERWREVGLLRQIKVTLTGIIAQPCGQHERPSWPLLDSVKLAH